MSTKNKNVQLTEALVASTKSDFIVKNTTVNKFNIAVHIFYMSVDMSAWLHLMKKKL